MLKLLTPYTIKQMRLANRVVMAPMTRSRAYSGSADENTALYYAQRASAGLLISEGVPVSEQGNGYLFTPGISTGVQIDGWRQVTNAVHQKEGKIFAQLWHVGRVSHTSIQPDHQPPLGPVEVAGGMSYAYDERGQPSSLAASTPRRATEEDIRAIIDDFCNAAENAIAAGFDGVEIHGANGYLFEQFMNPVLNTRTDRYSGATIESRCRLLFEVIDAVIHEIGADRVGLRLSPYSELYDMPRFNDVDDTYLYIAEEIAKRSLIYAHLVLNDTLKSSGLLGRFRKVFPNALIVTGGLTTTSAEAILEPDEADLIGFGTPFISNPDLVERIEHNWPWASVNRESFYGGGVEGYTDYPTYLE